jgi:primosomal protein N' (replication factor Y)
MRGFVTAILEAVPDKELLAIDGVVGNVPSFSLDDLGLLRWCATHYVAPLSTILKRTVPPNVPRANGPFALSTANRTGSSFGVSAIVSHSPHTTSVVAVLETLESTSSALIVVPSMSEATTIAEGARQGFGDRVVLAHSDIPNKEATSAWTVAATTPGSLIVGTREIALWPVAALARLVVVEDARRVMKSPATPTLGVREIAIERARRSSIAAEFISPLPSLEVLSSADHVMAPSGRCWPLVEVADRSEEPPTGSPILERTRTAIASAANGGGDVFVLVGRRGYAAAFRCTRCGALRRCATCGSALDRSGACLRCGTQAGGCESCGHNTWQALGAGIGSVVDDLARSIPGLVGTADQNVPVTVGTERDLIGVRGMRLAVSLDVDSLSMAPHYRAAEDALRLLVRLANTVERGRGNRSLVQTSEPHQPVVAALRSGRFEGFMTAEGDNRRKSGFPPYGQLIAIEVSPARDDISPLLEPISGSASVLGPAAVGERLRWLIQGRDLTEARVHLRDTARTLRDKGSKVRVDVDPIDL